VIGCHVNNKGHGERHRRFWRGQVQPGKRKVGEPTRRKSEPSTHDEREDQALAKPSSRELPRHHGSKCHLVHHQRRGVVEHPLALEDRDKATRKAQPARHRSGRHRVGRRHDGSEHKGGAPIHSKPVRDDSGEHRARHRQAHRQHDDGPGVLLELACARLLSGGEQERRQHQREYQFGLDGDRRHSRNKRHRQAKDREQYWQRNSPLVREGRENDYSAEQGSDEQDSGHW